MELEHRLSALLQLHLHSRHSTWLLWIGQRQLQDEARYNKVLGFGVSYIRDFTVLMPCSVKRATQSCLPNAQQSVWWLLTPGHLLSPLYLHQWGSHIMKQRDHSVYAPSQWEMALQCNSWMHSQNDSWKRFIVMVLDALATSVTRASAGTIFTKAFLMISVGLTHSFQHPLSSHLQI